MTSRYIQESARLAPRKNPDGTYRLIVIDEGEGSTGIYSAELLAASESVFENSASFVNHPIDPEKPHLRDLNTLAGRLGNLRAELVEGKTALVGDYKARTPEVEHLIEEFGDIIGASIFCAASGTPAENGKLIVEAFDGTDPYRSVDLVVAAGRGGRFDRAAESLRAIESSLGIAVGDKPGSTSAPGSKKEGSMEKEVLEAVVKAAIAEALAPVIAFVTEQKVAADAAVTAAEAKAEAAEQEKDAAVESYRTAAKVISDAKLLPAQEADIMAAAAKGQDVAPLIESATKVRDEAIEAAKGKTPGYIHESAGSHDFRVGRLMGA